MLKNSLLQIREFDVYDTNTYRILNVAWPIEIFECSASKKISKELDCLAEAVLKFIKASVSDTKEIASTLHISPDLVQHIKRSLFDEHEFIDESMERLTDNGKDYFCKTEKMQFSEKKVFGHMVTSLFDGAVMPFFIKGQMPIIGGFPTGTVKLKLPHDNDNHISDISEKNNAIFTKAYKKFCKIYDSSSEISPEEELEYLRSEYADVSFNEVDDESQVMKLSDVKRDEEIHNGQVVILNENGKQLYVLAQIVINKYNPDNVQMLSPFPNNITTWYNKKLAFFMEEENEIEVLLPDGNNVSFKEFISDELEEIAIEMPEIQMDNFKYYLLANYPKLEKAPVLRANIELLLKEYYSCKQRFKNDGIGGVYVVSSGTVFVETLLNNFIGKIQNRKPLINTNMFGYSTIDHNQIDRLFSQFGISDCRAKRSAPNFLKEMSDTRNGWDKPRRVGNSVTTRYFFLILEAFLVGMNPFRKLLKSEGQKLVEAFDFITDKRNTNSAHNDKEYYIDIHSINVEEFIEKNLYVTKLMVAVLAEEEIVNVK